METVVVAINKLIVTPKEAAWMLNMSTKEMYELLNEGIIKAYIRKGRWKVPVKSLEKYIDEQLKGKE